jgi:hypothetical protein
MKVKGANKSVLKDGIYFVLDENSRIRKFKPWLGDIDNFIKEIRRVMKPESVFNCNVPVPEKKDAGVIIHGNLLSKLS